MSTINYTLVFTEGRLVLRLFCIHNQYVSPNEDYSLWLHLKDGVRTLAQFSLSHMMCRYLWSSVVAIRWTKDSKLNSYLWLD